MTITIDDLFPEVTKAAKTATRSWTGALDAEDVEQDMWVKILESTNTLPSLLSYEANRRGKVLRAIARQCAQADVASRDDFSASATYSTDDVRRILEKGGADEGNPGSPSHIEWLDTQAGLRAIKPWYAEVVFSRYVVGDWNMKSNTNRYVLLEARDALTRAMNNIHKAAAENHDGPGSRKVLSNAVTQSAARREENR